MAQIQKRLIQLVVGVGVAAGLAGVGVAYSQLAQRYQTALRIQQQLEVQLGEMHAERQRLAEALETEQQRVTQLTQTLSTKEEALQQTMSRLTQEEHTIRTLEGQLAAAQEQVALVQGELAVVLQQQASAPVKTDPAMVQLDRVIVTESTSSTPGLQGRVVLVNPQWNFLVIDLGWDIVKVGDVVSIYRDEQLLAKARVERVQEQVSAATLLPDWTEADIQINDAVRVL